MLLISVDYNSKTDGNGLSNNTLKNQIKHSILSVIQKHFTS